MKNKEKFSNNFKEIKRKTVFISKYVPCDYYKTKSIRVLKPHKALIRMV